MSYWADTFGLSDEAKSVSMEGVHFFRYNHPDGGFCIDFTADHMAPANVYDTCGVLRTVISRNGQAMANGKWFILDANDITGSDVSGRFSKIAELLSRPNPTQEWQEFIIQCEVYRQLFAGVYIYASAPVGFNASRADAMWALAPDDVQYRGSGEVAEITLHGQRIEVPREHLVEIKDSGRVALGRHVHNLNSSRKSRVHAARFSIQNIIQAEQAIYEINRDRGALGAWVDDVRDVGDRVAMSDKETNSLLERLRSAYGIVRNRFKMMVIGRPMKWQQMSMNVKDLMLIEGMNKNMQTLCNVFDYPMELLIAESKYSNKEIAKGYYDDAVIPFSQIYASKLRHLLLNDEAYFVVDFSHVPAMKVSEEQKSKVYYQKAVAVEKMYKDGVISREEARLELGYEEAIEGKTMYKPNNQSNGGTDSGANQEIES